MSPVSSKKKYQKKRKSTRIRSGFRSPALLFQGSTKKTRKRRKKKTAKSASSSLFAKKWVKIPLRLGIFVVVAVATVLSYNYYRAQAANDTYTVTTQTQWEAGEYLDRQIDTKSTAGDIGMYSGGPGSWSSSTNVPNFNQSYSHSDLPASDGADLATDGTYIYVLKGFYTDSFTRFDPEIRKWTKLANTPVNAGLYGSSITYGGDGYIYAIFGQYGSPENVANIRRQFFRYSIADDEWGRLTNCPDNYYEGASLAGDGGTYIYMVRGDYSNSFFRYEIATNTWSSSLSPPPIEVYRDTEQPLVYVPYDATYASGCTGGCLYLMRGEGSALFYQYIIGDNEWNAMTNISGNVDYGSALTYDSDSGYIYATQGGNNTDFYAYDVDDDEWDNDFDPTDLPEGETGFGNGASIEYLDGYIYALSSGLYDDLYVFDPDPPAGNGSWETARAIETLDSTADDTMVYVPNGVRCADADGCLFYNPGGSTAMYRLDLSDKDWNTLTAAPAALAEGGALTWSSTDDQHVYAIQGGGNKNVVRYDIQNLDWDLLTLLPVDSQWGAIAVVGGEIFVMIGDESDDFYSMAAPPNGAWGAETATPWPRVDRGADMVAKGTDLYATFGYTSNLFYEYDTTSDTWTRKADLPMAAGDYTNTSLEYDGSKYIYAIGSPFTSRVMKYDASGPDTWTEVESHPSSATTYSIASAFDTANSVMYMTESDELQIVEYTPEADSYNDTEVHISDIIDLKYVASWQGFSSTETTPGATAVTYATRTSSNAVDWSSWQNTAGGNVVSAAARYIQVRTTLTSTGAAAPAVSDYTITYEKDSTEPTNPSTITGYSDSAQGTGITSGSTYSHTNPYISWEAGSDAHSGVVGYYAMWTTNASFDPTSSEDYYQTSTYTYYEVNASLVAGQTYYLRVATKDNADNTSTASTAFTYTYQGASPVDTAEYTAQADFEGAGTSYTNLDTAAGGGTNVTLESISGGAWVGTPPVRGVFSGLMNYETAAFDSTNNIIYLARGAGSKEFAKYDILNNSWTALADIGSSNNLNAGASMVFVSNGTYCPDTTGCLFVMVGNAKQEFLRYDINDASWSSLTDTPQTAYLGGSMAWNQGQYIYVATGSSQAFYRYDITNNTWGALASSLFDMSNGSATTFVPNGTYCSDSDGCVFVINGSNRRMYRYDIHADSWTVLAYTPTGFDWSSIAYNNSGKIYLLVSGNGSTADYSRMLEYDITNRIFSVVENELWPINYYFGANSLIFDNDHKLYFLHGNPGGNTGYDFFCYDLDATDMFGPDPFFDYGYGHRSAYDGSDIIYRISTSINEVAVSNLSKYTISGDTWEFMEATPFALRNGARMIFIANGAQCSDSTGCLFMSQGYGNASNSDKIFIRYDINDERWNRLADTPAYFGMAGTGLTWGGGDTIYGIPGGSAETFHGYSIAGDSWAALSAVNLPINQNHGTSIVADGDPNGYVYYFHDRDSDTFMKYDIDGNAWYANDAANDPPDTPAALYYASTAIHDGADKIYLPRGNSTGTFYQFDITEDSWDEFTPTAIPDSTLYPDLISIDTDTMYLFPGFYAHAMLKYVAPSATTSFKAGGSWTSPILDLGTVLAYANVTATYSEATSTEIKIETRSCDDSGCENDATDSNWSSWDEVSNDHAVSTAHTFTIDSDVAQYFQTRFWVWSDGESTATLNDITLNYYTDESNPTNPDSTSAYNSAAKATEFSTDTWYNDDTPYFEWTGATDGEGGSGIAGYYVYFGTDNTKDPYTDASDATNLAYVSGTNFYSDANWDASSEAASALGTNTYYLKLLAEDNAGNRAVAAYAAFTYKYDGTEPNNPEYIDADPDVSMTSSFSFTWPAGSDAHSGIASYCYKTGASSGDWASDQCANVTTIASVPAYQAGINVFYVRSKDEADNTNSSYTEIGYYYSAGAPSAPQNLQVSPSSSTSNSFTFTWAKPDAYTDDISAYHYSINTEPADGAVTTTTESETSARTLGPGAYATRQGENTFYILAEDTAGNLSYDNYASIDFTATTTAPGIPRSLQATDSSDRTAERWQITLTWVEPADTGSGIHHYNIQRSTDNQSFSTIATTSATGYLDTGLTRNQTYYYRTSAEDSASATSASSSTVSAAPTGRYTTPPTLVDGPDVDPRILSAKFTWTTNRVCSSFIEFGADDSYGQEQGEDDSVTDHEVIIVGLEPATVYHYRIKSADIDSNILYTEDATFTTAGAPSPPTNLTVDPETNTTNSFTVEWDPPIDEGVTIAGYYWSVNNIPNSENVSYTTNEYIRNYRLATQQGLNTFYVLAVDDSGNLDYENYASITFEVRTQAPAPPRNINIIDSSDRDAKRYSITLTWEAPEGVDASETITYNIWQSTDGTNFTNTAQTQSTSYLDTGLDNTKTYYYKLTASDSAGATSEFTDVVSEIPEGRYTTPPAITEGPAVDPGAYKAVITWKTERDTDAHVEFGTTSDLGNEQGIADMSSEHSITLEGLEEKTKYFYQVKSIDIDENENTSAVTTFTTEAAPYVAEVSIDDVRLYTATINWKTNKKTTTSLEYGTSAGYGTILTDTSGSMTTVHTTKIEGLKDSTTYHFKLSGADADGVVLRSDDYVFTTLTFPEIINVTSENKAEGQTEIRWQSNVPTTSEVEYYNKNIPAKTQGNTALVSNHAILLFGLEDATEYKYKVRGRDQFGYEAVSVENEFRTLEDTTPPVISKIESESNTTGSGEESKVRIIISWQTNEPADSQLEYGAGLTSAEFTAATDVNPELVRDHLMVISDLDPAKTYHFRIISKDKADNTTRSDSYSVLTTRRRESFLQLVIANLEKTFSWISNLAAGLTE